MEFNNLNCNILDILGEMQCRSDDTGPFRVSRIFIEFCDIPDDELEAAIMSLDSDGLLKVHKDKHELDLTPKGIAKVKSMQRCLKELHRHQRPQPYGCCMRDGRIMAFDLLPSTKGVRYGID